MIKEAYLSGAAQAAANQGLSLHDPRVVAKLLAKKEDRIQHRLARVVPHDDQPDTTRVQPYYLSTWSET